MLVVPLEEVSTSYRRVYAMLPLNTTGAFVIAVEKTRLAKHEHHQTELFNGPNRRYHIQRQNFSPVLPVALANY